MKKMSVRKALERILGSPDFDASARNRRFLEHIVEETLAGRADRLKGLTIAMDVFGRNVAFDPQHDPVVRIEAAKLRRSLERYYLTAGREDPIRIDIPKGATCRPSRCESLRFLTRPRRPQAWKALRSPRRL
jgi:hypothetical protein